MKLFDDYFYGKPDRKDYSADDQPGTRLQLFIQVLRVRWSGLMGLNLLYLLFWLPAVIWTFLCLTYLTAENLKESAYNILFTYFLLLWPLVAITGPANMGISYVLRNWARDEHAYAWSDFWLGLRQNWKQGLLLGFISGFVPLVLYIWFYIVLMMADVVGNLSLPKAVIPIIYVPALLTVIAAVIYTLSAMLMPTQIVTYRQRFAAKMKNAFIITLSHWPKALGIKLLTCAAVLVLCLVAGCCNLTWPLSLLAGLYCVILISFNKLIVASYANAMCEKYINPKTKGAQAEDTNKGENRS